MALLNQLPPEILALVFSWSLSWTPTGRPGGLPDVYGFGRRRSFDLWRTIVQEIQRLQLTCRLWNDVVISTPELWARSTTPLSPF